MRGTVEERFWAKVDKHADDECWLWTAANIKGGYGMLGTGNRRLGTFKMMLAHRLSLILHGTEVPDDLCVLHDCDNPPCVNPSHLFLGTKKDNSDDCAKKGRARRATGDRNGSRLHPERLARGETHPAAKLSAENVDEIHDLYADGLSQTKIAERFGVSQGHVSKIVRRVKRATG